MMKTYVFVAVNKDKWRKKRKNFCFLKTKCVKTLPKPKRKWYSVDEKLEYVNYTRGKDSMSIFDVANYILKKSGPMTTMKLEKLCYYAQAWSLAWDEIPLFDEDFQAWANGPVCPSLFDTHRGMFLVKPDYCDQIKNSSAVFTDDQKETIDTVLRYYGDKTPQWLSDLTHSELPWKNARGATPAGAQCNTIISKESMQQYYGGL